MDDEYYGLIAMHAVDGSCTHISYDRCSTLSYHSRSYLNRCCCCCCIVVAIAVAVDTATASPHIDIAAFVAAPNNITYNIACMFHTKQYLYPYQYVYGWVYHHLLYWYVYIDMELVLLMEMKRIWWRRFDDMVMELVMVLMMVKWMVMRISKYSKRCHLRSS